MNIEPDDHDLYEPLDDSDSLFMRIYLVLAAIAVLGMWVWGVLEP